MVFTYYLIIAVRILIVFYVVRWAAHKYLAYKDKQAMEERMTRIWEEEQIEMEKAAAERAEREAKRLKFSNFGHGDDPFHNWSE